MKRSITIVGMAVIALAFLTLIISSVLCAIVLVASLLLGEWLITGAVFLSMMRTALFMGIIGFIMMIYKDPKGFLEAVDEFNSDD